MEGKLIDARGMACPVPVVQTRKALAKPGAKKVQVLVDNEASCENVARMARSMGWRAEVDRSSAEGIRLLLTVGDEAVGGQEAEPASEAGGHPDTCRPGSSVVVLLSSSEFGSGDERLGQILMRALVKTLYDVVPRPTAIIFVNAGVELTTEGSELIEDIRKLEQDGVQIFSCGTCLDFYHLKEKLRVGKVSNMFEIVSLLVSADRVVRP